mmetsp:Transcript_5031/g.7159  ORF Transcript_5031/g.7159 Transcript_5031/m.7159 type:complete len:160 (+) Transcript_5031:25-504(+)
MNCEFAGEKIAPFNPSSHDAIEEAISLLRLDKNDLVYDLGCGDARFLIKASIESKAKGIGIEYDPKFHARALANVKANGLSDCVVIKHGDALSCDFSEASALYIYLLPKGIQLLQEKLEHFVKSGGRIASNMFGIPNLKPVKISNVKGSKVFLYNRTSL